MPLPFVIDNENTKLGDALNELLAERATTSLDIASAYFAVSGYRLVREGLQGLTSFRLLLGAAPEAAEDVGLRPHAQRVADVLRGELETATLSPAMMELVEDLIRFLRRNEVRVRVFPKGFLHAKCYLFYHDPPTEAPMQPVHIDHNPEVPRPAPAAADGASANPAPSTQPPAVNTGD